ncbi:uncharacterized protein [Panulirus ornatus]|uniref:uncharacterized protein n=1 Tax=Panulirus ornatus TaxID=150431 RepID=UPI003A88EAAB
MDDFDLLLRPGGSSASESHPKMHPLGHVSTKFLVLIVLLAVSLPGTAGIRILEMRVPPIVQAGKTVQLACHFDLEGANLYSLNWWRGSDQFYQFSPSNNEQIIVYDSPGITVDVGRSGRNVVVLRNISHDSAGRYKCEVLADYPSFEKDSDITQMKVIDVPTRPPKMVLSRLQWSPGETLKANCTSPGARPPSELHWFINGKKISPQNSRLVTPEVKLLDLGMGLGSSLGEGGVPGGLSRTSELTLVLRSAHFSQRGQATLTCAASLPGVYHRSAEIYLALPGFKTAAPSQKLYGSACCLLVSGPAYLLAGVFCSLLLLCL